MKRPDEKYVTERAYDHPKFVEDRASLNSETEVDAYVVEAELFESIQSFLAYALIERDKQK